MMDLINVLHICIREYRGSKIDDIAGFCLHIIATNFTLHARSFKCIFQVFTLLTKADAIKTEKHVISIKLRRLLSLLISSQLQNI